MNMLQVSFKNLERSELALELVHERFEATLAKFPELAGHRVRFTLSMDNSPRHPGPDLFGVLVNVRGPRFNDLVIQKEAESLYTALSDVITRLWDHLNRRGDRQRVKARNQSRRSHPRNRVSA